MRNDVLPYMSYVTTLYDIIMQTNEVIESVLKVSSLIIVLNGFKIVTRKFCHISRGGEKGENPLYFRKVMHYMHLECDLNVIVWGSTTVINVIPLKKRISQNRGLL
jgi:hypothetical protein